MNTVKGKVAYIMSSFKTTPKTLFTFSYPLEPLTLNIEPHNTPQVPKVVLKLICPLCNQLFGSHLDFYQHLCDLHFKDELQKEVLKAAPTFQVNSRFMLDTCSIKSIIFPLVPCQWLRVQFYGQLSESRLPYWNYTQSGFPPSQGFPKW